MAGQNSNNSPQMNFYGDGLTNYSALLSQQTEGTQLPLPQFYNQTQIRPNMYGSQEQLQFMNQMNFGQQYGLFNQGHMSGNMNNTQQSTYQPDSTTDQQVSGGPSSETSGGKKTKAYKRRKPLAGNAGGSVEATTEGGKNWKPHDYKVLAKAWVEASENPAGRSHGKYFYTTVNDNYNNDPECKAKRTFDATKTAWYNLNAMCTKYKGIVVQRGDRLRSGQTVRDLKDDCDKIYRETYDSEFKAYEAFEILSLLPRWSNLSEDSFDHGGNECAPHNRNVSSRISLDSSPAQSGGSPLSADLEGNSSNPTTPNSGMLFSGVANRPEGTKSSKRSILRNKESSDLMAASEKLTALLGDFSIASVNSKQERVKLKAQKLEIMQAQVQIEAERNRVMKERTERRNAQKEDEYLAKDVSHLSGEVLEYVMAKKRAIIRAQKRRQNSQEGGSDM